MAAPKAGAEAFALVSYFEKQYKKKYGWKPEVNKFASRWFFDTLLTQMPSHEAQALMDYYFTTASQNSHSLEWFQYNYHNLIKSKVEHDKDAKARRERAEASKRRTEEWRARIAKRTEGS